MTAFYKTFRRIGEQDGPIYRAIQYSKHRRKEIAVLCETLEADYDVDQFDDGIWIIESPFYKWPNGNIVYLICNLSGNEKNRFENMFEPATVDPWILSGGIDLSKCEK